MYNGRPAAVAMGGVPVAWTNRYEDRTDVWPVHAGGGFYLSVTLGAQAAEIAENPQIGLVLRVSVLGEERAGPEHGAPATEAPGGDGKHDSTASADSGGAGGAGWTGIAAAAGAAVMAALVAVFVYVRSRRGAAARTTRGSA